MGPSAESKLRLESALERRYDSSIHAHSDSGLCARGGEPLCADRHSRPARGDLNTALSLKGVPYVYGAESPPDVVDCSGFVQYVYKKAAGLRYQGTRASNGRPATRSR